MPTTKADAFLLLNLPVEMRKWVYDACDKQTLGRLAQACKQVNDEINPFVAQVGQETLSPWNTLRKRDFPNIHLPAMRTPQNAMSIYKAAKIKDQRKRQFVLEKVLEWISTAQPRDMRGRAEASYVRFCMRRWNRAFPARIH
jgi:hypothetical protein